MMLTPTATGSRGKTSSVFSFLQLISSRKSTFRKQNEGRLKTTALKIRLPCCQNDSKSVPCKQASASPGVYLLGAQCVSNYPDPSLGIEVTMGKIYIMSWSQPVLPAGGQSTGQRAALFRDQHLV